MKPKIYEPPFPEVVVNWRDACLYHSWRPLSEALGKPMDIIKTIGYLIFESDDLLRVVQSYGLEDSKNEMQVDSVLIIPQGWVEDYTIYLQEKET